MTVCLYANGGALYIIHETLNTCEGMQLAFPTANVGDRPKAKNAPERHEINMEERLLARTYLRSFDHSRERVRRSLPPSVHPSACSCISHSVSKPVSQLASLLIVR